MAGRAANHTRTRQLSGAAVAAVAEWGVRIRFERESLETSCATGTSKQMNEVDKVNFTMNRAGKAMFLGLILIGLTGPGQRAIHAEALTSTQLCWLDASLYKKAAIDRDEGKDPSTIKDDIEKFVNETGYVERQPGSSSAYRDHIVTRVFEFATDSPADIYSWELKRCMVGVPQKAK